MGRFAKSLYSSGEKSERARVATKKLDVVSCAASRSQHTHMAQGLCNSFLAAPVHRIRGRGFPRFLELPWRQSRPAQPQVRGQGREGVRGQKKIDFDFDPFCSFSLVLGRVGRCTVEGQPKSETPAVARELDQLVGEWWFSSTACLRSRAQVSCVVVITQALGRYDVWHCWAFRLCDLSVGRALLVTR